VRFEHDGFDFLQVEQVGEHESGRTRADDADLRAHEFPFAVTEFATKVSVDRRSALCPRRATAIRD
jgi:hypothetical protein